MKLYSQYTHSYNHLPLYEKQGPLTDFSLRNYCGICPSIFVGIQKIDGMNFVYDKSVRPDSGLGVPDGCTALGPTRLTLGLVTIMIWLPNSQHTGAQTVLAPQWERAWTPTLASELFSRRYSICHRNPGYYCGCLLVQFGQIITHHFPMLIHATPCLL